MFLDDFGVIIPAYNEKEHIANVILSLKKIFPPGNIVIVDDGSGDGTAETARLTGVVVIEHPENRGKGAALRSGFEYFNHKTDIRGVFTLDADGQHDPSEISGFIERFNEAGTDILIGNRMDSTENMPLVRKLTNRFTSMVISRRAGCRIEDSQSGYRLIKNSLLARIDLVTEHFETESEILIKAGRDGATIGSVPISTIYATEESKINPLRDTIRFLKLVTKSFFW
ncbi:MAG: glycosyltransferase family 2 protein [Candidatus Krumholzibacteria bacterium]|nr:glycosyltransferase family 2 protein [Candidatus Krumholzibacteria bacterium]